MANLIIAPRSGDDAVIGHQNNAFNVGKTQRPPRQEMHRATFGIRIAYVVTATDPEDVIVTPAFAAINGIPFCTIDVVGPIITLHDITAGTAG